MKIPYFHIDAFTAGPFSGNPAGVCLLEEWLPEHLMQQMAAEHSLPETAFVVPSPEGFGIRWFSPKTEVNLCGHATLAAAAALFRSQRAKGNAVHFESHSGPLDVEKQKDTYFLNFPSWPPLRSPTPEHLVEALGELPTEVLVSRDLIAVFENAETVRNLKPDFAAMERLETFGVIATAPGEQEDYVCRCFAPRAGIPEDPVTGSAQCELVPYWAARLKKNSLTVRQLSARGGVLRGELDADRVRIGGKATFYFQTTIDLAPL